MGWERGHPGRNAFAPKPPLTSDIHFRHSFIEPFRLSRPYARVFLNPFYSFARISALMRQVKAYFAQDGILT